jgi:hypothetical protein
VSSSRTSAISKTISKKSLLAAVGLLALTACSGKAAVAATQVPTSADSSAAQPGGAPQAPPGVSGLVAAVSGKTLQVQSTTSQTAVTYSSATALTQTVPGTAADVAVGMCAVVRSDTPAGGSAAPTAPLTAVTAATVQLSAPVNGSCTAAGAAGRPPGGGFGGGGGAGAGGGAGSGGNAPSGTRPSGGRFGGGFGGGAAGTVTAVSANGFTILSQPFGRPGATAAPSTTPTDVTVTTTAQTTYTKQATATTSALKVGVCVTARGSTGSDGTVAATAIAIRPATNGTCTTGGGFGGGQGAGAQGGGSGA